MLIILQKETNFLKKTLPYWNWKKTERLQHSPERAELLVILLKKEPEVLKKQH